MSTSRYRVATECWGCESYGAQCGIPHVVEVIEHNTSCMTTVRVSVGDDSREITMQDDEFRGLCQIVEQITGSRKPKETP